MPVCLTADKREERVIRYLESLNKGQLMEFRLSRMNRVANFRKSLMQLLNSFIEARAEELAAVWIEQFAEPRPKPKWKDAAEGRLPIPVLPARKRRMPRWVGDAGNAAKSIHVKALRK